MGWPARLTHRDTRHGVGLLSIGATSTGGFNALSSNWAICQESAKDHGHVAHRANWRLVGPMHIAETREQARADVAFGLEKWMYYFRHIAALPLATQEGDPVDTLVESGLAVIGTPDDAVAQLERLEKQSGGYGAFLLMDHNWAPWERKKNSYELIARYVVPHMQGSNVNRDASLAWARDNREQFMSQAIMAVGERVVRHMGEKGDKNIAPEILEAMGLKT